MYTKVIAVIEAVAALVMIGATKMWAPVCAGMLTLENGNQVHMKCHYTGQVVVLIAAIILVAAIVSLVAKKGHKAVQVVIIVAVITLFIAFTGFMGICMNSEMACHDTALWVRVCAAITGIAAVADIVLGKEGQIPS